MEKNSNQHTLKYDINIEYKNIFNLIKDSLSLLYLEYLVFYIINQIQEKHFFFSKSFMEYLNISSNQNLIFL